MHRSGMLRLRLRTTCCRPAKLKSFIAFWLSVLLRQVNGSKVTLKDTAPGAEDKEFTFDHAYQEDCTQQQVYEDLGQPIVAQALEGYNGNNAVGTPKLPR